ncbi:hypothetical protein E1286_30590, partial [Nonomuraea terrae]
MDGFLDRTCGGVTELRVHGVSGTPPAGMLNHPHPRLVAGDGTTGFYRRWWAAGQPAGDHPDVPGVRRREAYAWGNLTSGGRTIALWLLLLPFALANLSYFMLPRPPGADRLRHLTEAAQRLFGLLLTGTLVGAVTRASVDLVGWQCTAAGRACTVDTAPVWVHWLGALWGGEPSKRLAVTALVPLLAVVVLWWIARRTWRRDERTDVAPEELRGTGRGGVLLGQPRLWHGRTPVWRLRVVHVSFAIASIGLAVSAPFAHTPVGFALTAANAGVQLAAAVLVVLPATARRLDPYTGGPEPAWLGRAIRALRVAAPVVFLVTGGAALAGLPPGPYAPQLPGVGVGVLEYALMIALGVFILAAVTVLARRDRTPGERRAMGGLAAWFALMVAVGSANVLALGVLFWTASFFGVAATSAGAGPLGRKLFLDDTVWWTAALVPLLVLGAVVVACVLNAHRTAEGERLAPLLEPYYGEVSDAREVAGKWALATLTDRIGFVVAVLTGLGVAGFAAVTVIYRLGLFTPDGGVAGLLASIGSWAMVAIVVGLVLIGRRTYIDSRLRRTVGILWDICTFWPRAIHPLAPPCYTERVIPELMARVARLARTDRDEVVLSGHSQGSVIAAALVLQLRPELRGRVRLLTHGSPLGRLYAPFFPAYFGAAGLSAVRDSVTWCNLYRLSDPIGGPVFATADPLAGGDPERADAGVDRFCWDPPLPGPGEPLPECRWHSDYWLDPPYAEALSRLATA